MTLVVVVMEIMVMITRGSVECRKERESLDIPGHKWWSHGLQQATREWLSVRAMPCPPLSARSTNTFCNLKKYILWIEKKYISPIERMHFSYCTTRKGCNSCVLGGRAFPLCAESPHPAPCQSLKASLTNTLQNFEQILLPNIRQNLSCSTHHMTCSLSCFICRLDRACKITHPWWLRQAKI